MLKAGAKATINMSEAADGTFVANRITITE